MLKNGGPSKSSRKTQRSRLACASHYCSESAAYATERERMNLGSCFFASKVINPIHINDSTRGGRGTARPPPSPSSTNPSKPSTHQKLIRDDNELVKQMSRQTTDRTTRFGLGALRIAYVSSAKRGGLGGLGAQCAFGMCNGWSRC